MRKVPLSSPLVLIPAFSSQMTLGRAPPPLSVSSLPAWLGLSAPQFNTALLWCLLQRPKCIRSLHGLFILLTPVSWLFSLIFSSTVVNAQLLKQFMQNEGTQLKIEWAGVCGRAWEVFDNRWLVECMGTPSLCPWDYRIE